MLSGIFYGLRISLGVGVASTVFALAIGLVLGLVAAYFGGWVDTLIMRIVDIQLSFPAILIALVLLAVLGQGVDKIIVALVTVQWAYYARTVRSSALVERQKEYIEAAQVLALCAGRASCSATCCPTACRRSSWSPRCRSRTRSRSRRRSPSSGLGLPITEPSLGLLISNGFQYLLSGKYWISFYPGLALLAHDRGHQPRRRPAARHPQPEAQASERAPLLAGRRPADAFLHQGRRGEGRRRRELQRRIAARSSASSANPARASR